MENVLLDINNNEVEKKLEIAFAYKHFMQSFFPYKKTDKKIYERVNNFCSVSLISSSENVGLPYGIMPRILSVWLITQAVKQKTSKIYLPATLTSFVNDLGFRSNGGIRGDITRIKDQLIRLIHTAYSLKLSNSETYQVHNVFPIKRASLWWDTKSGSNNFDTYIELSEDFISEVKINSVPVNFVYIKELTDSCLAFDIYVWLCYRFGYLKEKTFISWSALKQQFGSQYKEDKKAIHNFKAEFLSQLKKVLNLYTNANIYESSDKKGLILLPSQLNIPRKLYKIDTDKIVMNNVVEYPQNETIETKLIKKYGFSKIYAEKIMKNKSIESIEESIRAVDLYIQNKTVSNLQSIAKKAIDEEWKSPISTSHIFNQELLQNEQRFDNEVENDDWRAVRNDMKVFLGEATYRSWICSLVLVKEENDTIALGTNNTFIKHTVEDKFLDRILLYWSKVNPKITKDVIEKISGIAE